MLLKIFRNFPERTKKERDRKQKKTIENEKSVLGGLIQKQ